MVPHSGRWPSSARMVPSIFHIVGSCKVDGTSVIMHLYTIRSLTVAGHSAHSSCLSRSFQFSEEHPLIRTATDRGVGWATFDNISGTIPATYNLEDLFTEVSFAEADRERICNEVESSKNLGSGRHPIAWVKSVIDNLPQSQTHGSFSYTADFAIKAMQEGLMPFLHSTTNRPDGVVLRSFHCNGKEWKLPLLILEVHSSPYKNSVSQTAADVLDQFRLLRCFNPHIPECVGFTFPKYATTEATNTTCVTKVTVGFEQWQFMLQLHPLACDTVQKEIEGACTAALRFQADTYPAFYFLRLSPAEMCMAGAELRAAALEQHPSMHSIVLKSVSAKKFWKYIPQFKHREALEVLQLTIPKDSPHKHITLYSEHVLIMKQRFFVFEAQIPPLSKDAVAKCLLDFMKKTATALEELHSFGFAHLDVRIPNICFALDGDNEYIVKLIDLERCCEITCCDLSCYKGEMYRPHGLNWKTSQYDWKQLGLLAAEIIFNTDHDQCVADPRVDRDDCLRLLIKEGQSMVHLESVGRELVVHEWDHCVSLS